VLNILTTLLLAALADGVTVAVITPYKAQAALLQGLIDGAAADHPALRRVVVITGDSAQGLEYDLVVISPVRADGRAGFLDDERRANVMATRPKEALWIVGRVETLELGGDELPLASLVAHVKALSSQPGTVTRLHAWAKGTLLPKLIAAAAAAAAAANAAAIAAMRAEAAARAPDGAQALALPAGLGGGQLQAVRTGRGRRPEVWGHPIGAMRGVQLLLGPAQFGVGLPQVLVCAASLASLSIAQQYQLPLGSQRLHDEAAQALALAEACCPLCSALPTSARCSCSESATPPSRSDSDCVTPLGHDVMDCDGEGAADGAAVQAPAAEPAPAAPAAAAAYPPKNAWASNDPVSILRTLCVNAKAGHDGPLNDELASRYLNLGNPETIGQFYRGKDVAAAVAGAATVFSGSQSRRDVQDGGPFGDSIMYLSAAVPVFVFGHKTKLPNVRSLGCMVYFMDYRGGGFV
jgi:hypothetical protein